MYEKMKKRGKLNVIIWSLCCVLWSALSVWRILAREDILIVCMTVGVALLSIVCLVLNLFRLRKLTKVLQRSEEREASVNHIA